MAPAERVAARLSQHISESNALNRAIQINLISEDEDNVVQEENTVNGQIGSSTFFQKRAKLSSDSVKKFNGVRLKRISSSDPPPFPLKFQLSKVSIQSFEIPDNFSNRLFNNPVNCNPIDLSDSISGAQQIINLEDRKSERLAKIMRETYSEIDIKGLKRLNSRIDLPSQAKRNLFTTIFNEVEVNLSSEQPILWVFTGPSGVGKTKMFESLAESLDLRLITIDSTQSPRNGKTFETLQTTLSHSVPKSFSQFFPTEQKGTKQKVAILFDEVEIAFESDRGYWSALSSFLQSPVSRTVPIFITSNADTSFLESIIKFPDHVRFTSIKEGDHRKLSINNDFIGRLHRIDTSLEYEHLAMSTGYFYTESESDMDTIGCDSSLVLINEALRWNGLIDTISTSTDDLDLTIDPFSYAEFASFSDILLSVKEDSVKMNLDFHDNIDCEFFDDDEAPTEITLLYSIIPEIYEEESVSGLSDIAKECIGMTIKKFTDEVREHVFDGNDSHWIYLSKKLSRRFYDYTRSLHCLRTWSQEIASYVIFLELNNFESSSSSRRRKRAFYRYLGEELLNEILDLKSIKFV